MTAILGFWRDVVLYAGRIRDFQEEDWAYYIRWVGLMFGLLFCTGGFVLLGWIHNAPFPAFVWNVPLGTAIFIGAIAFDTIGHQTAYKEALKTGERLVHSITIFSGVSSCIVLCLAYHWPGFLRVPAWSLVILSIFYSVIDEWMHWTRYMQGNSDRVEMWSHFFIFLGHSIMIASWLMWFEAGYPGVAETIIYLPFLGG